MIALKRQNISPFMRHYEKLEGESYEIEAFMWQTNRYGDVNPISLKHSSFTGAMFNGISRRVMWLSLATWGELSMTQMLRSVNSTRQKGLEAAVAGTLSSAVNRGVLEKKGRGMSAVYRISKNADARTLSSYLPFNPVPNAIEIARTRAKNIAAGKAGR